jgi:hypothetical protein
MPWKHEFSRELYELLNANRPTHHDNGGEIASRYGLRKVLKEEFEEAPQSAGMQVSSPAGVYAGS